MLVAPASRCQVVIVDVQTRFSTAIPSILPEQPVGRRLCQLAAGAQLVGVRILFSEQLPGKLGPTLDGLRSQAGVNATVLAKSHFSVLDEPEMATYLMADPDRTVVLAGIEAHICVLSTLADLRRAGRNVVLCGDAIASRDPAHVAMAVAAARDLGASVLPVESVLFSWLGDAAAPGFKALSGLVR